MEKLNFVRDGMMRLPPGFRFQPTDEELVFQYLKRKILCWPLPASIIPELNVCKFDPWDLPGDSEGERYFFSKKEAKYPNGNRVNRSTASGYWKATGSDKLIASKNDNHVAVGMKKSLVFYRGKPSDGSRTDWIMHEYRLVMSLGTLETTDCNFPQSMASINNLAQQNNFDQLDEWVICRVFLKNKGGAKIDIHEITTETYENNKNRINAAARAQIQPRFLDLNARDTTFFDTVSSCSSSFSSSSGITDIPANEEDHAHGRSRNFF